MESCSIWPSLVVEVVDQNPALAHGELDVLAADVLGLPLKGGSLGVEALLIDALAAVGTGGPGEADIHGLGLDGLDEALGDESDDVGFVGEFRAGRPERF